jgi:hypothetical protein
MPRVPDYIGWPGADEDGGYVESGFDMKTHIERTMPVCYIAPKVARIEAGLEVYTLEPAWGEYKECVATSGVDVGDGPYLKVMYQNVSPFSETYSNTFSISSLLSGLQSITSEGLQDIVTWTGRDIPQNLEKLGGRDDALGAAARAVSKGMEAGGKQAEKYLGSKRGKALMSILQNPNQRIDWPQNWRSSGYAQSYDLTVRLYNPFPKNDTLYGNLIVAPYAAMLGMCLPYSDSGNLYRWPFLFEAWVPGLFRIKAGYISNLSVVKGGDVNDTSYRTEWQRPNIIDMRFTLNSVYSTMLMSKVEPTSESPTLTREIQALMTTGSEAEAMTDLSQNQVAPGNINTPPSVDRAVASDVQTAADALSAA